MKINFTFILFLLFFVLSLFFHFYIFSDHEGPETNLEFVFLYISSSLIIFLNHYKTERQLEEIFITLLYFFLFFTCIFFIREILTEELKELEKCKRHIEDENLKNIFILFLSVFSGIFLVLLYLDVYKILVK